MTPEPDLILVQDSREQHGWGPLFETPHVVQGLSVADYSVLGLEDLIGIERKSLPDLLNSLTNDRSRFESELKRARSLHKFYVLIESSPSALLVDDFGKLSRAHPRSIWGTICAWGNRFGPFLFGQDRTTAAKLAEGLLLAYGREFLKGTERISRAIRHHTGTQEPAGNKATRMKGKNHG